MELIIDPSMPFALQHESTAGVFNGTEMGRALHETGVGASDVRFSARRLGDGGNAIYVKMVDPGRVYVRTTVRVYADEIEIVLRHSGVAITATAAEVAAAVNAFDFRVTPGLYVVAHAYGAGVVSAMVRTPLLGGVAIPNPEGFTARLSAAGNGGLFFFDQNEPLQLMQVETALGASVATVVSTVDYRTMLAGATEAFTMHSVTSASILWVPTQPVVLLPGRGVKITAAATGIARVTVRRMSRQSYL